MKTFTTALLFTTLFMSSIYASENFSLGLHYYSSKNYDKAREYLQKEVVSNSSNGNAYYFLGETEKNTSHYLEAEEYYRKAVAAPILTRKYLSLAYWNLVVLVEQRNNVPDLIRTCKEFWARTRDERARKKIDDIINKLIWTDNQQAIDIYKEAMILRQSGKSDLAKQKYIEAIKTDPAFLAPRFEIGMMLYNTNNNAEAAQYLKEITDKMPYYATASLLIGEIYYQNSSFENAAKAFSDALEFGFFDKSAQFGAFSKLAGCYYNLHDYEKSVDFAKKALAINNNDRDTLMLLSAVNIKRENYAEALESLTKLNTITPNDPDILLQLGSLYYKQGNIEKCSLYFSSLFAVVSKSGPIPAKYQKAVLILFKHEYEIKSYERAIRYAEALPASARDFDMNISLGKSYYQVKNYEKAISTLERLALNNDDKLFLCRVYLKAGLRPKAKTLLTSLISFSIPLKDKALADRELAPLAKEIIAQSQPKPQEAPKQEQPAVITPTDPAAKASE